MTYLSLPHSGIVIYTRRRIIIFITQNRNGVFRRIRHPRAVHCVGSPNTHELLAVLRFDRCIGPEGRGIREGPVWPGGLMRGASPYIRICRNIRFPSGRMRVTSPCILLLPILLVPRGLPVSSRRIFLPTLLRITCPSPS